MIPASIKPLTLFFIDKVANYHPPGSKFRMWFEDAYAEFLADGRYRALTLPAVSDVHDGYFATSAKGEPKDIAVGKDTKDAESAYERIMKDKERLLASTRAAPLHLQPLRPGRGLGQPQRLQDLHPAGR